MKSLHPARKRLLVGFLLLAGTFFYAFAGTCGLIGQLIARASAQLLGQTGSTLVALVMLGVGLMLVIPHGAIGGFVRWVAHGREARVARVVREMDAPRGFTAADVKRAVAEALAKVKKPEVSRLPPAERMRLDDVRTAMTDLGYKDHEYEPIVAGLDPKVPLEVLLRTAIKALHKGAN